MVPPSCFRPLTFEQGSPLETAKPHLTREGEARPLVVRSSYRLPVSCVWGGLRLIPKLGTAMLFARVDKFLLAVETVRRETSADTKALLTMRASLVAEFPEAIVRPKCRQRNWDLPRRRVGRPVTTGVRLKPEGPAREEGGLRCDGSAVRYKHDVVNGGFPGTTSAACGNTKLGEARS
jgi:hypothetical protein